MDAELRWRGSVTHSHLGEVSIVMAPLSKSVAQVEKFRVLEPVKAPTVVCVKSHKKPLCHSSFEYQLQSKSGLYQMISCKRDIACPSGTYCLGDISQDFGDTSDSAVLQCLPG